MMAQLTVSHDQTRLCFGDDSFPVESLTVESLPEPHQFETRMARVKLDESHTLSVVWGSCTYSDNHDYGLSDSTFTETPERVEIAVFSPDGMMEFANGDTVCGYVPVASVAALIEAWPAALSARTTTETVVVVQVDQ